MFTQFDRLQVADELEKSEGVIISSRYILITSKHVYSLII